MGVGDKQWPVFKDHQRQCTARPQSVVAKDLVDIFQVPPIFAKCTTNQTIRFAPVHHDRSNRGGVGAHDRLGQIGGNPTARHQLMIAAPIVPISAVVFWVHNVEIPIRADIQSKALTAVVNDLGAADQNRQFAGFFQDRLRGAQNPFVFTF